MTNEELIEELRNVAKMYLEGCLLDEEVTRKLVTLLSEQKPLF